MTVIRSRQNLVFKELKQIGKKGSFAEGFLAEGLRLIETVLASSVEPLALIIAESFSNERGEDLARVENALKSDLEKIYLADDLFGQLADTNSPQGLLLLCKKPAEADFSLIQDVHRLLILDRVQDPGNVGTLLRLAAGLDFGAVVLLEGSADPYEAKTIRSAMGASFQVPIVRGVSWAQTAAWLDQEDVRIYAADMNGSDLADCSFHPRSALVLGNEGNGLSESIRDNVDEIVSIPLAKGVESLNVAVAGAIIAYQMKRMV